MDIKNKKQKKNPFLVPENYFNSFHRELMLRISNTQQGNVCHSKKAPFITYLRRWSYAAAIICVLITGVALYKSKTTNQIHTNSITEEYSNEYIDELLDNYSIDDYTFYCYITNTDTEF